MPMPRLMAHINKRTFNKLTLKKGSSPVLIHVGRTSGKTYHTPLDAIPVENGYIFFFLYTEKSDWVRNVMAAGTTQLAIDGQNISLDSPRFISRDDAQPLLPPGTSEPPKLLNVSTFLRMDITSSAWP